MQDSVSMGVEDAIERFQEDIDELIRQANRRGIEAFSQGNHTAVRAALKNAEQLQRFRDRLTGLRSEWTRIVGGRSRSKTTTSRRGSGGTPQREFRLPILMALVQLGGSAPRGDVLDQVGTIMAEQLNRADHERLPSRPDGGPRWRNTAAWERQRLVTDGLLRSGLPRGIWEISDLSRQFVEEHRA